MKLFDTGHTKNSVLENIGYQLFRTEDCKGVIKNWYWVSRNFVELKSHQIWKVFW